MKVEGRGGVKYRLEIWLDILVTGIALWCWKIQELIEEAQYSAEMSQKGYGPRAAWWYPRNLQRRDRWRDR